MSRHKADGTGRISDSPSKIAATEDRYPAAFQITVYDRSFQTPDWMKGSILYQIFPDRFSRGDSYKQGQMQRARQASERIYHEDWYDEVDIDGHPDTGYIACDFFGGTLDGITEKIPYIKDLNIDCLYLNPIFEARSNHRYDTADYLNADPMLGGIPAYERFSERIRNAGMKFILDGVFSHTGADSRYFNKLERYKEPGAYNAIIHKVRSKYSSWYSFYKDEKGTLAYDSWWGFADLPNVNENDLSYRDYMFGDDGVIRTWLRRGASGFRLDVSDELPDSFLRELRATVKEETQGNGFVLGEVWEDASNKISYGSYRDFLLGRTHDAVMGYTFRDSVLGFFTWAFEAQILNSRLESFRENYPPQVYYCNMNLISSHDVPRAITVVGGDPDPGDRITQKTMQLNPHQLRVGLIRVRLALLIQMCYVGAPCIYYGDEVAMEGYRDPFNRRTYPWNKLLPYQEEQLKFFQWATSLRKKFPVLKTGCYRTLYAEGDIFVFERFLNPDRTDFFGNLCEGVSSVILAINRNDKARYSLSVSRKDGLTTVLRENDSQGSTIKNGDDIRENQTHMLLLEEMSYSILTIT
jgi:4-alpha-glucanotransferase